MDGRWLGTSMPGYENDFIIDYIFLLDGIIFSLDENFFVSFLYNRIPLFIYYISESLELFYFLVLEFSLSVIPTLIIIGFLSWIIMSFVVKQN